VPADPEIIRSKLLDISEAVSRLRSWLPLTTDRLEQDVMLHWAVEHGLHIAAEALLDAGNHLLSGEFQVMLLGDGDARRHPGRVERQGHVDVVDAGDPEHRAPHPVRHHLVERAA
jgi:hypothetical protein